MPGVVPAASSSGCPHEDVESLALLTQGLPSGKHTKNFGNTHHFSWENSIFLWPFSIAMFVYQRVLYMGFYGFFGCFLLYMDLCCFLKWISVAVYIRQYGFWMGLSWFAWFISLNLGLYGLDSDFMMLIYWRCIGNTMWIQWGYHQHTNNCWWLTWVYIIDR